MELTCFGPAGKKTSITSHDDIFGSRLAFDALRKVMHVQGCNERQVLSAAMTKGMIRGGGRKPFRQKGTGHARQGSIRNPHYRGGGVAFGPNPDRNYAKTIPVKEKRLGLFAALSFLVSEGKLFVIDLPEKLSKVSEANDVIALFAPYKSVVLYTDQVSAVSPAFRNLSNVTLKHVDTLKARDLLTHDGVFFSKTGLHRLEARYIPS